MKHRRVVVTGLGMVTPGGLDVNSSWSALTAAKSGVRKIKAFDSEVLNFPIKIAAEVLDFDPSPYFDFEPRYIRKGELFVQYAVAAASQAVEDAGLEINEVEAPFVGVSIGAGMGGLTSIQRNHDAFQKRGIRGISPWFIPYGITNMIPGLVAMKYHCLGPNFSLVSACSTGAHNIGNAARLISYGDVDVMIAGGCEMATSALGFGGFAILHALSRREVAPELASCPWDKERDGFIFGEGAGVLILEEYEHAKRRGARIYAELVGYGASDDGFHATLPEEDGLGARLAMQRALEDGGCNLDQVGYINAHATSTHKGDIVEVRAIKKLFGNHAKHLMISSTKSMFGHLLGAAGAVEAIVTVLSLYHQTITPTINLHHPDEECDLDFVPLSSRMVKGIDLALSNSFGFGGTNASLAFKRM